MKMSNIRQVVMMMTALSLISASAFARGGNRRLSGEISESSAASVLDTQKPDQLPLRSQAFALGYTVGGPLTSTLYSLTAMLKLTERDLLQPFLVIPGTSPFQISSAIAYKRTIASSPNAGFHIGAGVGFGAVPSGRVAEGSTFNFTASALTGLAFKFAGTPNIQVHIDGGPCFQTAGGASNFTFDLLSASAVYWF